MIKIVKTEVTEYGVTITLESGVTIALCPAKGPSEDYILCHFSGEKNLTVKQVAANQAEIHFMPFKF